MEAIDDAYISRMTRGLILDLGLRAPFVPEPALALIKKQAFQESIISVAKHMGLPIRIELTVVPRKYDPHAQQSFNTRGLVVTDGYGRGSSGITAQIALPSRLPDYGSMGMTGYPFKVRVSENCGENPFTFLTVIAHELSHVVLHSKHHPQRESEYATDLTGMIWGFHDVFSRGRKQIKSSQTRLGNVIRTSTLTTTFGYLDDHQFAVAKKIIDEEYAACDSESSLTINELNHLEGHIEGAVNALCRFERLMSELGRARPKRVSLKDTHAISSFHAANFTTRFESALLKARKNLAIGNLKLNRRSDIMDIRAKRDLQIVREKIQNTAAYLNREFAEIRRANQVLSKHVSWSYKLKERWPITKILRLGS